ncbi:MAG: undecaprenyldiphospho-muramoylpentapeptide beta-N-acetylglucosaminyltransferase [Omnitrophica bacterium RBG_13_46_9]|nr:MAG: undecaprenyldiphospho-muramoylpentapeptide beta-N-acetylglucosaminyltransferase [Omnitrophica bacterium RBG_13_46_9]
MRRGWSGSARDRQESKMKILLAAGGSGGHIFPAAAVAEEFYRGETAHARDGAAACGTEILFVASRRNLDRKILRDAKYRKIFIPANPMPHRIGWRLLVFSAKLAVESLYALCILARYRPHVVVGFGGFTAGVMCLFAALFNIKVVLHEQNVVPCRTNRLLDRFADKVAISFTETKKYFRNRIVVFTGNPLRKESLRECRPEAIRKFGLDPGKFTLLIMGGSQGASSLNHLISNSLGMLPPEKKGCLQVIHITGPRDFGKFEDFYRKNGMQGRVFGFVESINEAYSACDLAVSRSGAAAIFELAVFAKPMILIPYPSRRNNQRFNATFFAEKKAAICRNEGEIREEGMRDLIMELVNNTDRRRELSENARRLGITDGAERLRDEIKKTAAPAG